MRTWQVERRKRTRHLIELGGLVVKDSDTHTNTWVGEERRLNRRFARRCVTFDIF